MKKAVMLIKNMTMSSLVVFTIGRLKNLGRKNKYLFAFQVLYLTVQGTNSFLTQKINCPAFMKGLFG